MPNSESWRDAFRRQTFRMTLSQFGAGMVFLTGLGVALVAYVNSQATVRQLSLEIFDGDVTYSSARAADYSDSAQASIRLTQALITEGLLPSEPLALGDHLVTIVTTNARLTTAGFGAPNGDAVWATRELDGRMRLHEYVGHDTPSVTHRSWEIIDGRRVLELEEPTTYDASVRPWFLTGMRAPTPEWTEPYLFIPDNKPGISLSNRVVDADGTVLGVLTVDFRVSFLSKALKGLDKGYGTHGVIFDDAGYVLGHSDESKTKSGDGESVRVATLADHEDPLVRRLATVDLQSIGDEALLEFVHDGKIYAMAIHRPEIDDHGQLAWWTAVIVPEAALLRDVRSHALWSVAVALLFLLLAVLLSVVLSRHLTQSFYGFYDEMERVGRLELGPWSRRPTRIAEMERLGDQLERLKGGLQAFSRYVPVALVRQVIDQGGAATLGGRTQEVTVLFTDIAGFTTTVEHTPPEDLLDALGEYLAMQDAAIRASDGNVTAFLGDGLMALFGAPVVVEHHALNGCRAALASRDQARKLAIEAGERGGPAFPTRIGLNTGEVLVGNIGSPERFDFTAIGDVVNTASRIEGLNKMFQTHIIVGERTREAVGDAMVFRALERVRMKGKQEPVLVFELVDEVGRVDAEARAALSRYEEALEAYWRRDFDTARRVFEAVDATLGGDVPSQQLAAACRAFLVHPPSEDWDGTRVLDEK
jgi:adenylate cyclase